MTTRCTAEQLAEAVALWSVQVYTIPILCKDKEDADSLKPLDLILSTMDIFIEGFMEQFKTVFDEHKRQFPFSKKNFIDYLKPRCLRLAQKKGCFDLFMACAFVSEALDILSCNNSCCHFSKVACKVLTKVIENRFSETFNTDSGWEELMDYCKTIHYVVLPSKQDRSDSTIELPDTDSGGNEDSENKDESDMETDLPANILGQNVTEGLKSRRPICSSFLKEVSESESSTDDETYRYCKSMRRSSISELISDSREQLSDILDLLASFVQKMEPEQSMLEEFEIDASDDEELESIEKRVINLGISEFKVKISEAVLEHLTERICKLEDEESDKSSYCFEEFTDAKKLEKIEKLEEKMGPPKNAHQCDLCYLKKRPFKTKWLKSFNEKYSNCEFVSDFLNIRNERVSY